MPRPRSSTSPALPSPRRPTSLYILIFQTDWTVLPCGGHPPVMTRHFMGVCVLVFLFLQLLFPLRGRSCSLYIPMLVLGTGRELGLGSRTGTRISDWRTVLFVQQGKITYLFIVS